MEGELSVGTLMAEVVAWSEIGCYVDLLLFWISMAKKNQRVTLLKGMGDLKYKLRLQDSMPKNKPWVPFYRHQGTTITHCRPYH